MFKLLHSAAWLLMSLQAEPRCRLLLYTIDSEDFREAPGHPRQTNIHGKFLVPRFHQPYRSHESITLPPITPIAKDPRLSTKHTKPG
jgi:hypothetical protein